MRKVLSIIGIALLAAEGPSAAIAAVPDSVLQQIVALKQQAKACEYFRLGRLGGTDSDARYFKSESLKHCTALKVGLESFVHRNKDKPEVLSLITDTSGNAEGTATSVDIRNAKQ